MGEAIVNVAAERLMVKGSGLSEENEGRVLSKRNKAKSGRVTTTVQK